MRLHGCSEKRVPLTYRTNSGAFKVGSSQGVSELKIVLDDRYFFWIIYELTASHKREQDHADSPNIDGFCKIRCTAVQLTFVSQEGEGKR